jgi:hypothetical protein
MSTPSETISAQISRQAEPLKRLASSEAVVQVKDGLARLVSKYPASSLLGAFAVGFALARLFRRLSED